jgi:hypothetical protein
MVVCGLSSELLPPSGSGQGLSEVTQVLVYSLSRNYIPYLLLVMSLKCILGTDYISPACPMQKSVSRAIGSVYIIVPFSDEPLYNFGVALPVEMGGGIHGAINYQLAMRSCTLDVTVTSMHICNS